MRGPTGWLAGHAAAEPAAEPTTARAVWLTGQSSWRTSHLSPAQQAVLDALEPRGWTPLRVGFPWTTRGAEGTYRREPLPAACVRNALQWAAARPGRPFAEQAARHLQALLDRTTSDLLLLTGSAGMQILAAAAPSVRTPAGLRVHVVGLAPVGARPPARPGWSVRTVRGSADLISRLGHRVPADVVVPGGHLAAPTSPAAVAAVLGLVVDTVP